MVCPGRLGPAPQGQLLPSLSDSVVLVFAAWKQLWQYLHHRNWQTPHVGCPCLSEPGCQCFPARHWKRLTPTMGHLARDLCREKQEQGRSLGSGRSASAQQAPACSPCPGLRLQMVKARVQGFRTPERRGTSMPWGWPLGRRSISASLSPRLPAGSPPCSLTVLSPSQTQSPRGRGRCRMSWTCDRTWKRPCPACEAPR